MHSQSKPRTLHDYLNSKQSIEQIQQYLSSLSIEEQCKQAQALDDNGLLPIELCKNYQNQPTINALHSLLLPITLPQHIPLHEETSVMQLRKCLPNADSNLIELIAYAFNEARRTIQFSGTHPSINLEDYGKKLIIRKMITNLRVQTRADLNKYRWLYDNNVQTQYSYNRNFLRVSMSEDLLLSFLDYETKHFINHKMANCNELSYIILRILKSKMPSLQADVYFIQPGDHYFVILNLPPDKDTLLESDAIVLDGWAGVILPIREYVAQLRDYKCFETDQDLYNLTFPVDRTRQRIVPMDLNKSVSLRLPDDSLDNMIIPKLTRPQDILYYLACCKKNILTALTHGQLFNMDIAVEMEVNPMAFLQLYSDGSPLTPTLSDHPAALFTNNSKPPQDNVTFYSSANPMK